MLYVARCRLRVRYLFPSSIETRNSPSPKDVLIDTFGTRLGGFDGWVGAFPRAMIAA